MLTELALLGMLLFGLVLLVIGVVLLFKEKNKLTGALISTAGLVISSLPVLIYLFLTVTSSIVSFG